MALFTQSKNVARKRRKIPDHLVYEIIDGRPFYWKGYKQTLQNEFNEVGISGFQSVIVSLILHQLFLNAELVSYRILAGKPGLEINTKNILCGDIFIYHKEILTPGKITNKYIDIPPFIYIEVDILADIKGKDSLQYITQKTKKLLDFGTQKVIWVLPAIQKTLVATQVSSWQFADWSNDVEILDGQTFNIARDLKEEGIHVEKL
ncbi:MAG: Uma2 family endonuclease [Bacteroidota bacterium]